MASIKKKICLLGSFAVGKTSLVERFVYDRFDEKYLTTMGVKISQKVLPPFQDLSSGKMIQHTFLIWDIAGLAKFDNAVMNYFRGASGALAVADLTRRETIGHISELCDKFKTVNPNAVLVVLGNKMDIFIDDQKALSELNTKAADYDTDSILTSAKTGEHVEQAFLDLSHKIGVNQ
jgi:small GTP-binding protein